MKFNIFKSLAIAAAATMMLGTTSCVNDLDVENINPKQIATLDADALFNKIYSSFVLTGQQGPSDDADIEGIDEGRSEFFRMCFSLNEYTTDEASWIWLTDVGLPELLHNTYGADNAQSQGLYYRLYFTITLCNFYLEEVKGSDAETAARRAEVRFIRSLAYYYVMDLYGNATFTTKVINEPGPRYTRSEFFKFIEKELIEAKADMKEAGQNQYGRVDKVAADNLLARLYLNAEVYTGEARWADAKTYAESVLNNGYYELCTTGATSSTGEKFNAYQMLFLADNNSNGAQKEIIYPVIVDGINTKSYGATDFLVLSTYASEMSDDVPSGTTNSWGKCMRVRGKLVDIFTKNDISNKSKIADVVAAAGDDRALFYTKGYTKDILDESENTQGYSCVKFRNVTSTGAATSANDFVDTDLPLMRLAEAYLTFAEADARLNGGVTTTAGADMIKTIRSRANADISATEYTLDQIRDEWAREFWFEGRRRMDLVRFGCYADQTNYTWRWMGGAANGTQIPAYRSIFGLPVNDLTNNPNLKQNLGY